MATPIATLAVSYSVLGTHLQDLCYALSLKFPLHIARVYLYFRNLLEHHFLCVALAKHFQVVRLTNPFFGFF